MILDKNIFKENWISATPMAFTAGFERGEVTLSIKRIALLQ